MRWHQAREWLIGPVHITVFKSFFIPAMASRAADLLPVADIAMNNTNAQHDGPQYTIITTKC